MFKAINEIGNKYGKLTVIDNAIDKTTHHASWLCVCECGNKIVTTGNRLRRNISIDCGNHREPDLPNEEWKVLKRNKDYAVSNMGRVRRETFDRRTKVGKILKFEIDKDGYLKVRLGSKGGKFLVHRLVFEEFCGEILEGKECNHIDGDKTNNKPENLEYITNAENHKHAMILGLKIRDKTSDKYLKRVLNAPIFIEKIKSGISYEEVVNEYKQLCSK